MEMATTFKSISIFLYYCFEETGLQEALFRDLGRDVSAVKIIIDFTGASGIQDHVNVYYFGFGKLNALFLFLWYYCHDCMIKKVNCIWYDMSNGSGKSN